MFMKRIISLLVLVAMTNPLVSDDRPDIVVPQESVRHPELINAVRLKLQLCEKAKLKAIEDRKDAWTKSKNLPHQNRSELKQFREPDKADYGLIKPKSYDERLEEWEEKYGRKADRAIKLKLRKEATSELKHFNKRKTIRTRKFNEDVKSFKQAEEDVKALEVRPLLTFADNLRVENFDPKVRQHISHLPLYVVFEKLDDSSILARWDRRDQAFFVVKGIDAKKAKAGDEINSGHQFYLYKQSYQYKTPAGLSASTYCLERIEIEDQYTNLLKQLDHIVSVAEFDVVVGR